ncbi:MAG: histidine phosphatase family protein [Alphaproteobacteria bacterium]|nr:histidine phosphatase family protein [Alphaproteobacteria bacterium]MBU1513044.1 histidine phosphatase family protein [Alphaproteobacteria bacterium]MBU2095152.1 histidine phosphatase family protein [Alphaproteobacteria bacterium]MBU2152107.1 histidine phosphatase family protein [Alphaproteobacteria bacterium]MBU2306403.1 histidine phosphatase family protein [Alphaproteobacteria bacterium]
MTAASLILVRHGRPVIDRDIPPPQWGLCPEGRDAVAALAEKLIPFGAEAAISSPEPKALQTAEIIGQRLGLAVEVEHGLHEHKRSHVSFGTEAEFRQRIAQVFANPTVPAPGGESAEQACDRLATTLAKHTVRPLIAVTHGTVLSLYVARLLGLDAHDLWRNLHTPDAFVLDANGALIERV